MSPVNVGSPCLTSTGKTLGYEVNVLLRVCFFIAVNVVEVGVKGTVKPGVLTAYNVSVRLFI